MSLDSVTNVTKFYDQPLMLEKYSSYYVDYKRLSKNFIPIGWGRDEMLNIALLNKAENMCHWACI